MGDEHYRMRGGDDDNEREDFEFEFDRDKRDGKDDDEEDEDLFPSQRHRTQAEETVARILVSFGLLGDSNQSRRSALWGYQSLRAGVFLADVENDAHLFARQIAMARDEDVGFPCIVYGEDHKLPTPLDVFDFLRGMAFLPGPLPFRTYQSFRSMVREFRFFLKALIAAPRCDLIDVEPSQAIDYFRRSMTEFLEGRFSMRVPLFTSAKGVWVRGAGVRFKVITKHRGERVHYSPAYFQKVSTVFGSPTTPVKSWIQPGRYTFSVVGQSGQIRLDPGEFQVPPSKEARLII